MNPADNFLGCSKDVFHRNADVRDHDETASAFCTRENWQSAVLYLGQELEILGLPNPCAGGDVQGSQAGLDIVTLVNACSGLIHNLRAATKTVMELESRLQRLHNDLDRADEVTSRQKEVIEVGRRQVADADERERQAGIRLQEERDKLRQSKDEAR